jgi:hypothetical protein
MLFRFKKHAMLKDKHNKKRNKKACKEYTLLEKESKGLFIQKDEGKIQSENSMLTS